MKKLFALILAVVMITTMSVTAFAANTTGGETEVSFNVDPTYTVTIPATVELQKIEDNGTVTYENDYTLTAEAGLRLKRGEYIEVTVASNFKMTTTEGATLAYSITAGGNAVGTGGVVAEFETDKTAQSTTIHIAANDPDYAGEYKDTVIFTITVKDAPTISFKFYENGTNYWSGNGEDYVVYTVLEGTTWGEWLASEDNVYNLTDGEECIYAPGPAFLEYADKEAATSVWPLVDDEIIADAVYVLGRY